MEDQSHSMEPNHDLSIKSSLSNIAFEYKYLIFEIKVKDKDKKEHIHKHLIVL